MLIKLAFFYRAKFFYEESVGHGAFGDLERAEGYLILAYSKKRDFTIKNELGSLYGQMYLALIDSHPDYQNQHKMKYTANAQHFLDRSEKSLQDSVAIDSDQQRAYHGLAVIAGSFRQNYPEAIKWQRMALNGKVWQREASQYMTSLMHYNMACYESRLLQKTVDEEQEITREHANSVISHLEVAAGACSVRESLIEQDFKSSSGDFWGLKDRADQDLKNILEQLETSLRQKASTALPHKPQSSPGEAPGLRQASTLFLRALRKALKRSPRDHD